MNLRAIPRQPADRQQDDEVLRAEEASRASEEKYHALYSSIDEGFCVIEILFATFQFSLTAARPER
jgi:hypothetical protein